MNDSEKIKSYILQLKRYVWALMVAWTVVVAISLVWNVIQIKRNSLEVARIQARTAHEKDVIYRRWNTGHGGVYVWVTEASQPNPYLSETDERDITTPSGKLLTLMNPAYMTRQVHELAQDESGVHGHITSLNPIRLENAPDPWETDALQAFERGETEISSLQEMKGEEYMRLMRPLITERGCLKCHAAQGYQEGDIRGGISVSIPMESLKAIAGKTMVTFGLGHVVLWLMGLVGIFLGNQRLRRSERERTQAAEALRKAHDELEIRIQERTAELLKTNEELQMEITERKRAQEKLKRLVTDLERSNWELKQFAKVTSHDLQEPLRMVASYTQLLEKRYKDKLDSDAREFIGFAVEGATRMQRLINDLLAYSYVGATDKPFEPTDCYSALGQAIANLSVAIEENHAIIANDDLPSVMVDASQMVQLFQNLIGNAIKFCGEQPPRIHVSAQQKGDEWVFSVQDNGIGIESQYKEKIFVVFQRLHAPEEYPGTGMGLAICKKIVERHGGRIWVDSEPGGGSTFYFTLPVRGSKEPSRSKATVEIAQEG